jgi:putative DNA primase/helicase
MSALRYFSSPSTLFQITPSRLIRFMSAFTRDIQAAGCQLPAPNPQNDSYFECLADALSNDQPLPESLRSVLLALESAASPENLPRLHALMEREFPNFSACDFSPLDAALELWFQAPEKLAQFAPSIQASAPQPEPSPEPLASQTEPPPCSLQPSASSLAQLLSELRSLLTRFVVLPPWAPETIALWILHTYVFEQRDITTYLGIESPVRRCGKTTLLTLLSRLVNRPIVAANVSSSALFRAIEELRPTLMIDEADTFLKPGDPLQGILNAGYSRSTAYVLRVDASGRANPPAGEKQDASSPMSQLMAFKPQGTNEPSLAFFSCWCPKVIAQIGRIPETLADRCILIHMQRKTPGETCERLRELNPDDLRHQCARFALDHAQAIAAAKPNIPAELNDRAADIWEPLLVIADLAGGSWPELARQAAVHLSTESADANPVASLLIDIFLLFAAQSEERLPTRQILDTLNTRSADRPWAEGRKGRPLTERDLARQLRPFGISPRTLRFGDALSKGYLRQDFSDAFQRYIPAAELRNLLPQPKQPEPS